MNTSGEVADLMAKEAIQMTESAVKLTALGVKNLAAIVMALANDDGKTEGVAKLKQMLKTGKQLCIMQIKEADLKKFTVLLQTRQTITAYAMLSHFKTIYPGLITLWKSSDIPQRNTILSRKLPNRRRLRLIRRRTKT